MTWYQKIAANAKAKGKFRKIMDRPGENLYLTRYYLHPRWITLGLFRVVLHQFHRSDDPKDGLHDHPWPYITVILKGDYFEHLHADGAFEREYPVMRKQGSIIFARAKRKHRITLIRKDPVWTLFIMGPRIRTWQFHINGIALRWDKHIANRRAGKEAA